jgi:hypothetical protein
MFEEIPKARSDFKAGTLYAIWGIAGWIYYGQLLINPLRSFFAVIEKLLQAGMYWSRRLCRGWGWILRPSAGHFGRAHGKSLGNIPCVTN